MQGPLFCDSKIRYYFQPQLNLQDDKFKVHSGSFFAGVGYQTTPDITFWIMNGWHVIRQSSGSVEHRDTIRQQLDWRMINNDLFSLISQTRLEERKNSSDPEWSMRLRQK